MQKSKIKKKFEFFFACPVAELYGVILRFDF